MSAITGISQFIGKLMTAKPKGFQDGMSALGDFDPEQFVNANLERAKNTPGTEINQVTQGIAGLLGLAPKNRIGKDPQIGYNLINDMLKGE